MLLSPSPFFQFLSSKWLVSYNFGKGRGVSLSVLLSEHLFNYRASTCRCLLPPCPFMLYLFQAGTSSTQFYFSYFSINLKGWWIYSLLWGLVEDFLLYQISFSLNIGPLHKNNQWPGSFHFPAWEGNALYFFHAGTSSNPKNISYLIISNLIIFVKKKVFATIFTFLRLFW